jgi:hypothetical protein
VRCGPCNASDAVNDVWSVDVVFDTTQQRTTVKFLTLLDSCEAVKNVQLEGAVSL